MEPTGKAWVSPEWRPPGPPRSAELDPSFRSGSLRSPPLHYGSSSAAPQGDRPEGR